LFSAAGSSCTPLDVNCFCSHCFLARDWASILGCCTLAK
jgi:hypothetical protein